MPFKSPFPDVEIPEATVFDHVFGDLSVEDAGRVAVVDGDRQVTYGELKQYVELFAGALAKRGVQPGDVVALHCPNTLAFVIAFHGILRAGATATTLNSLYGTPEIISQLTDSGARRYVTISLFLPQVEPALAEVGIPVDDVLLLDDPEKGLMSWLTEGNPAPEVSIDPATHLAVLPYSSGTTGKGKGVMLTHRNLVANIAQFEPMVQLTRDAVVMAVLPFFHIYGMNVLMNTSLHLRAKLVTMPRFELEDFLRLIQDQKITMLYIAPPMAVALAKHPMVEQFDLSSVERIMSGAAPLDEALGNTLTEKLGCSMLQGYGMTELSPVTHLTPPDRPDLSVGSIGLAIPNVEQKVVDTETGEEIEPVEGERSRPGELWVRGPMVMKGYLGNDQATAETIDDDGFLHTGDIVEIGAQGEIYVVDRLKELIKYKGYQVPPAELEAVLLTHPAVADSAVVAYPDEEGGEVPRAFVVKQPDAEVTAEEIMEYVAGKVAPYKKIRMVEFIDAIPKSAAGKILRKDLRVLPASS